MKILNPGSSGGRMPNPKSIPTSQPNFSRAPITRNPTSRPKMPKPPPGKGSGNDMQDLARAVAAGAQQ